MILINASSQFVCKNNGKMTEQINDKTPDGIYAHLLEIPKLIWNGEE